MIQKLHPLHSKLLGIVCLAMFSLAVSTSPVKAQQPPEDEQFKPLRSDVGIVGLSAKLHWYNFYSPFQDEMNSNTELELQFRNIRMLSSHVGVGYKAFASVYMTGFFEGAGIDAAAIGPMLRYYLLETTRWQPYLQGSALIGYNLALADALGANTGEGVGFRTALRAGLTYKVTNAFGIFLEAGPTWEYDSGFSLDAHALQVDFGIQLFLFN
ncbi:MAG TPA: hypothetical protein VF181_11615 [Balneolaceae bacterium]